MLFEPRPEDTLTINEKLFEVVENPSFPGHAYVQEGRKSLVYKLREKNSYEYYALKVFKPAFCDSYLFTNHIQLKKYNNSIGMRVCERVILSQDYISQLQKTSADLEFAVLMPWIDGFLWSVIIMQKMTFSKETSFAIAFNLSEVLSAIERNGNAHCDIAGENIIVDLKWTQKSRQKKRNLKSQNLLENLIKK